MPKRGNASRNTWPNCGGVVEEANRYAAFFGFATRLTLPDDLTGMIAECQAIKKRDRERKQREERKRERESIALAEVG